MLIPVFYCAHSGPALLYIDEPRHPFARCSLEYLNEGGANFVFRIVPGNSREELPLQLRHRLLRLRKNLPHVQSAQEQLAAFDRHFTPLLPLENLIQQELIALGDGFVACLNEAIVRLERPARRAQDKLPLDERYGLLITDMTPEPGGALLQMKPKWLAQSPNAPSGAVRCRTCALRAKRSSSQIRTATDAQESCPLALVSPTSEDRKQVAQNITDDVLLQHCLVNEASLLLETLRVCQTRLDPGGVLGVQDQASLLDLCKAMTLRDCTLFLKRSENHVEIRFADLDLKQDNKLAVWKKTESSLIAEGWYTNSEDEAKWTKEIVCLLSRQPASKSS